MLARTTRVARRYPGVIRWTIRGMFRRLSFGVSTSLTFSPSSSELHRRGKTGTDPAGHRYFYTISEEARCL